MTLSLEFGKGKKLWILKDTLLIFLDWPQTRLLETS